MKKLFCLFLIACMIPVMAYADMFTNMPYSELLKLHRELVQEIMSRSEWKEIEVPAGNWTIGVDIPEGYYSIKSTHKLNTVRIEDANGKSAGIYKTLDENEVVGKTYFPEGMIFTCWHPVLLSPPLVLGF